MPVLKWLLQQAKDSASLNLKCILLTTQFGSCTIRLAAVHATEGDFMMLEVEVKQMTQAWLQELL
jgi:hypothetical protein